MRTVTPEPTAADSPARPPSAARSHPVLARLRAPLLAFLLTAAAVCTAWAARGASPFGSLGRAVNDQANQYVPFHRGLWDLAHGQAAGDLLFTWRGGFGQQFLSDHHTYLGNPFSWAAVLVPRDHVDLAVFAITPLTTGTAAAAMAVYLGRLRPGPWWQRGVLGACYGLCGWALSDASYIPMWLWGLVALPLLGIAVEWCIQERRWPGAALLVALAWLGNFYTAMMATTAACVLLAVRLATADTTGRQRLRALWRAATAAATGILLTLPLLLPSFLSSGSAQPTEAAAFRPVGLDVLLSGMLPATHLWGGRPRLYVASLATVLALTFLFHPAIARRTRLVWGAATVLVLASFQFPPTQYAWHGLAVPNGNPYRETFVFSALLVVLAWLALAHRPRPLHAAAAAAVLAAAAFLLRRTDDFGGWTWPAVLVGGALSVLAVGLLHLGARHRILVPAAAVLMAGLVFAESAAAAWNADVRRARERWAKPAATSGRSITAHTEAVRQVSGWPAYRTDSGAPQTSYNDALALRAEGPQYYSSYLPEATYEALEPLGYGFKNDGRTFFGADNPVLDAVFAIGARVRPGPAAGTWTASRFPAPPAGDGPQRTLRLPQPRGQRVRPPGERPRRLGLPGPGAHRGRHAAPADVHGALHPGLGGVLVLPRPHRHPLPPRRRAPAGRPDHGSGPPRPGRGGRHGHRDRPHPGRGHRRGDGRRTPPDRVPGPGRPGRRGRPPHPYGRHGGPHRRPLPAGRPPAGRRRHGGHRHDGDPRLAVRRRRPPHPADPLPRPPGPPPPPGHPHRRLHVHPAGPPPGPGRRRPGSPHPDRGRRPPPAPPPPPRPRARGGVEITPFPDRGKPLLSTLTALITRRGRRRWSTARARPATRADWTTGSRSSHDWKKRTEPRCGRSAVKRCTRLAARCSTRTSRPPTPC
ncbi:YfhO family protein [Streptomyces sp. CS62]|uniref:YfhO family protein n=1 Tax=Streptomyces sp. CS62 TaxID=3119268 RepID=UPI002F936204